MKDFFISSSLVNENSCSMPQIIRFYQYDNQSEFINSDIDLRKLSIPNSVALKGSFGNQGFDFTVYFPIIKEMEKDSNIEWLFKRVLPHTTAPINTYNQVVSKRDIFNKFYVIEISDYGAQANSPFFTDFTTHIYFDGYKLWQKYICFIKNYSRRKVYVLIDKGNNLGDSKIEGKEVYIRICFKEKERNKNNTLKLELEKNENKNTFSCETTSWFNFSSFESEEYNLLSFNDFKFFTSSGEINPFLIKKCTFQKVENTLDKGCDTNICNQTIKNENGEDVPRGDYFREVYTMNNLTTNGPLFEKTHGKIKISVVLKDDFKLNDVDEITISFNSMVKEADYVSKIENSSIFDNYFNNDGKKVTVNIANGSFEKIPEYSNITRFYISGSSKKGNIQSEAYSKFPNVSRLNITNPLIIAYNDGLICSDDNADCDYAYIYDSGELENKEFERNPTDDIKLTTIMKSIDNINNFSSLTNLNVSKNEKSIVFFDDIPYSFLVRKSSGNFMNVVEKITFTMVSRAFLIPLEVSVISNSLIYCKIPDYFFTNDYWNNSERNPLADKLFLRNLEPTIFYSGVDLTDVELYRIDNFEKETLELESPDDYINGDQNKYLGNINLINFANRNL